MDELKLSSLLDVGDPNVDSGSLDEKDNSKESNEQLLSLFNKLFNGSNISDIDKLTGLPLSTSLNYSLKTCLQLNDQNWVLCMLNIDNFSKINHKLGYEGANQIIRMISNIIKEFCLNKPHSLKSFRNKENGKGDLFAILMHSKKIY